MSVEPISYVPGPGFLLTLTLASGPVTYISSLPFPKPQAMDFWGEKVLGISYVFGGGFLGALNVGSVTLVRSCTCVRSREKWFCSCWLLMGCRRSDHTWISLFLHDEFAWVEPGCFGEGIKHFGGGIVGGAACDLIAIGDGDWHTSNPSKLFYYIYQMEKYR